MEETLNILKCLFAELMYKKQLRYAYGLECGDYDDKLQKTLKYIALLELCPENLPLSFHKCDSNTILCSYCQIKDFAYQLANVHSCFPDTNKCSGITKNCSVFVSSDPFPEVIPCDEIKITTTPISTP